MIQKNKVAFAIAASNVIFQLFYGNPAHLQQLILDGDFVFNCLRQNKNIVKILKLIQRIDTEMQQCDIGFQLSEVLL